MKELEAGERDMSSQLLQIVIEYPISHYCNG
jgi:hypothetical protein